MPLNFGPTTLHIAADLCNLEMVGMLVEHGAPLNVVGENKNALLNVAALKMDKRIVELLIRSGANEKIMNAKGLTPLQGVELTFATFIRARRRSREHNRYN
jgi:ankyrin repeat protein